MQISSKNFIASQALYGRMISHPDWTDEQLVQSSYKLAEMMMARSKSPKRKKKRREPIVYGRKSVANGSRAVIRT